MLFIIILFILIGTNYVDAMYDGITGNTFHCEEGDFEISIAKSSEPGGLSITKKYWKSDNVGLSKSFTEKFEVQDIKRTSIWNKSTTIETDKGIIYLPSPMRSIVQNPTFNGRILKLITYTGHPTLK